jgi:hypothetical protein|tara:strand:- start:28 stop:231 length:204 start_codon:yes stop_codon:yes gene_type:complete
MTARYDDLGQRTTDCCGVYSEWFALGLEPEVLSCKKCYHEVPVGQGDGSEFKEGVTSEKYWETLARA